MEELFGTDRWRHVLPDLGQTSLAWWKEHQNLIEGIAKDEAAAIMAELKSGDTAGAKFQLALRMNPQEWRLYRDGTVAQLRGVALRRAKMLEALEDLGIRTAKAIGTAALAALLA